MKIKKLSIVIILGLLIVAFAGADIYFIMQGKQSVEHVKIEETETEDNITGDIYSVEDGMEAFTVTEDSPEVEEDMEPPFDGDN